MASLRVSSGLVPVVENCQRGRGVEYHLEDSTTGTTVCSIRSFHNNEIVHASMIDQPSVPPSGRSARSFHVVAKPIGSHCNLDCTYCCYSHKGGLLPSPGRISDDLLEEFIRQYITGQEVDEVRFNWHGGEPALLGLDFYTKVVELQRKYAGTKRVANEFQTNGVLLDEAWCEFFREHGFYVGLSIDGPKHLHDQLRSFCC
jgi:serine-type anaerobic sulfatase-maturating enzyme